LIFQRFVECHSCFGNVFAHYIDSRPVSRLIRGQTSSDWIDAEGKKAIKLRMERSEAERTFAQKVPVKRLKMPDIEDDAMSFRNGAVVEGIGPDDREQRIGIRARFGNALKELMTRRSTCFWATGMYG